MRGIATGPGSSEHQGDQSSGYSLNRLGPLYLGIMIALDLIYPKLSVTLNGSIAIERIETALYSIG